MTSTESVKYELEELASTETVYIVLGGIGLFERPRRGSNYCLLQV